MNDRDEGRGRVRSIVLAGAAGLCGIALGCAAKSADAATGDVPKDVRSVVDRAAGCRHFAGEFNGDRSARDREVTRSMARLRCDRIERDLEQVRARHRGDARVTRLLDGLDRE